MQLYETTTKNITFKSPTMSKVDIINEIQLREDKIIMKRKGNKMQRKNVNNNSDTTSETKFDNNMTFGNDLQKKRKT